MNKQLFQWRESLGFPPFGTVVLNRSSQIVFFDQTAASLLGFDESQTQSNLLFEDLLEDGSRELMRAELSHSNSPGVLRRFALLIRCPNGGSQEMEATAWTILDEGHFALQLCPSAAVDAGPSNGDLQIRAKLVEETHEPVFAWQIDGTIQYWNVAAERLYGYSRSEASGRSSHQLLQTVSEVGIGQIVETLRKEKRWAGELVHRKKTGETIVVESRMTVSGEPGNLLVLESNRDITDRKSFHREFHFHQQLSLGIFRQAVDSIFITDWHGQITSINPEAERVFGWTIGELSGKRLHETLHHHYLNGDVFPASECPLETVYQRGEAIRGAELVFFSKDGSPLHVSCSTVPLELESRRVGAALIVRDISQRKTMEQALIESEERLRLAVASARIGTWDYNPVTKSGQWDAQCKIAFGLPASGPAAYQQFIKSVHPEDRSRIAKCIRKALNPTGKGHFSAEFRTVGVDDHVLRHVYARGQVFFDESDAVRRPARFLGTVADVSARKRGEDALRRANEDLLQFAYAAAHDLQEPLRNVVNLLGLYKRTSRSREHESADELLDESIEDARRMHRMVQDLLSFTKINENGAVSSSLADSNEVLSEVLRNIATTISEARAVVKFDRLPVVNMQPTHLLQLFQNLISNALKYRRENIEPVIGVTARRRQGEWLFSIRDNGIGFEPIYAERIFGVFKRLHNRRDYPGSGIGLAICSRIVALYGGRIWAEGQPGAGSTFFFTVPKIEL